MKDLFDCRLTHLWFPPRIQCADKNPISTSQLSTIFNDIWNRYLSNSATTTQFLGSATLQHSDGTLVNVNTTPQPRGVLSFTGITTTHTHVIGETTARNDSVSGYARNIYPYRLDSGTRVELLQHYKLSATEPGVFRITNVDTGQYMEQKMIYGTTNYPAYNRIQFNPNYQDIFSGNSIIVKFVNEFSTRDGIRSTYYEIFDLDSLSCLFSLRRTDTLLSAVNADWFGFATTSYVLVGNINAQQLFTTNNIVGNRIYITKNYIVVKRIGGLSVFNKSLPPALLYDVSDNLGFGFTIRDLYYIEDNFFLVSLQQNVIALLEVRADNMRICSIVQHRYRPDFSARIINLARPCDVLAGDLYTHEIINSTFGYVRICKGVAPHKFPVDTEVMESHNLGQNPSVFLRAQGYIEPTITTPNPIYNWSDASGSFEFSFTNPFIFGSYAVGTQGAGIWLSAGQQPIVLNPVF